MSSRYQYQHPSFDDPNVYVFYRYYPSLAAAVIFIILFSGTTFLHIWQATRKRTWFMIPFIVGGFFQLVGYIGRALSSHDQWLLAYYIMQACLLLVAPALFAASIYMTLGRIILLTNGEKHSLIRRRWLTKLFVAGDVTSFAMQGSGAGMMAGGTEAKLLDGEHIVVGGLVLQIVSFSLFIVVALVFHRRILRDPTDKSRPESGIKWQRHLFTLYGASTLILIRSAFRVIEYSMGNDSFILRHEVFLYIFDSVLMISTMALLNIVHPGEIIIKKSERVETPVVDEGLSSDKGVASD